MKTKIFTYILSVIFVINATAAEKRVTIEHAIQIAKKNNHELNKIELQRDLAAYDLYNVYSEYLPHVSATSKSEKMKMRYQDQPNMDRDFTQSTEALTIDQSISLHKMIPKVAQGHKDKSVKNYKLSEEAKISKFQVIETFIEIYKNQNIIPMLEDIASTIKTQKEIAEIKLKHDHIKSADLMLINAHMAEINAQRYRAVNDLDIAINLYNAIVGEKHSNLEIPQNITLPYKKIEQYIETVMNINSGMLAAQETVGRSKYALAAKSADLLPEVKVGYAKTNYKNLWYMPNNPDMTQNSARIEVQIPIFDGGRKIADVARHTKELRLAILESQIKHDTLIRDASRAWNEFEVSREMLKHYQYSLKSLEDIYTQKEIQYRSNKSSMYQLLDAKRSMLDTKMKLLTTRCNMVQNYYKILNYIDRI